MPEVAIAIPLHREWLTPDESISLHHLQTWLAQVDKFWLAPETLKIAPADFPIVPFSADYFESVATYSRLLLSPKFYSAFAAYDYILIYQLDCLVFSEQLLDWCRLGYDYIGAPLFEEDRQPPRLSRVGNGGLSLRRVQAFLDVLNSPYIPSWMSVLSARMPDLNRLPIPKRWLKKMRVIRDARRGVKWYSSEYGLNEDLFWSDRARLFRPRFNIAPLEVALRFAFERNPVYCFKQNNNHLPFGAHAWAKWDRVFWEPYLLS